MGTGMVVSRTPARVDVIMFGDKSPKNVDKKRRQQTKEASKERQASAPKK